MSETRFGAVANGQASASCADAGIRESAVRDGAQRFECTGDGDPGSTPGCSTIKPQRVRFGPGELRVTESWYQRKERQQDAYFDAMQADVTGAYQWPTRECAGGCGKNVSGPWDKCLLCGSRERHEKEFEEANNQ